VQNIRHDLVTNTVTLNTSNDFTDTQSNTRSNTIAGAGTALIHDTVANVVTICSACVVSIM
jgi:hypothetical protein